MPRRDGYPTNQELLVDFTTEARHLYVLAYQTHIEGNIPPAYREKPIAMLGLEVVKRYLNDSRPLQHVSTERLGISSLKSDDIGRMREQTNTKHLPEDVFEFYEAIVARLGATVLSNAVVFDRIIPPGSITASYIASFPSGPTKSVDTLSEKPTKQAIISATYFTKESLEYIRSGESGLPVEEKLLKAVRENRDGVLQHTFTLPMTPELPLNGHEGTAFLYAYREQMNAKLRKKREMLDFLTTYDAPSTSLERAREQVARYAAALVRVERILDKK
ncbi:MAG TPA: hypothetical protein VFH06_03605 [Candidatus Saccharimonadales bacterium]|nr:hypothetical protein [Candidatus Saccharimonadales bacterium]